MDTILGLMALKAVICNICKLICHLVLFEEVFWHLVLLLGSPLAVVEDDRDGGDVLAHAGVDLKNLFRP
jgi:hypothetical protein